MIWVMMISSKDRPRPGRIFLEKDEPITRAMGLRKDCWIYPSIIRTIDQDEFLRKSGAVPVLMAFRIQSEIRIVQGDTNYP